MLCPHGRAACHACYMREYRSRPGVAEKHRAEVSAYQRRKPEANRAAGARYRAKKRRPRPTLEQRFWSKVVCDLATGCALWMASLGPHGYGQIWAFDQPARKAHRVAWVLETGEEAPTLLMHDCDTPRCVRIGPGHVRPGSQTDNMRDAAAKGRVRNQHSVPA